MAAEKKAATPTLYLVLRRRVEAEWETVTRVPATSAPGAIRAVVAKLAPADQAGLFVAIPVRSWHPTKVEPQTTIRLELTEAKP